MPKRYSISGPYPQPRAARLGLESLEDRTALSSTPLAHAADHILVQYRPSAAAVALPGTTLAGGVEGLAGLYKVNLSSSISVTQALAAYKADSRVLVAEPDYNLASTATTNDSRAGEQWAWSKTGANSAWNVSTGSTKFVVSVMDTGVDYTHPDLAQNIWLNQGEIPASRRSKLIDTNGDGLITFRDLNDSRNQGVGKITDLNGNGFIDGGDLLEPMEKSPSGGDTGRGGWADNISNNNDQWVDDLIGWNFVDNSNDPMDDFGHGTHVAGSIGAVGNNGIGVSGVNWAIQMMPIKFMSATGAGSVSAFIAGLNYAVQHGAKISNNSWTGTGDSTLLQQAVQSAQAKQHIFVAAAGNSTNNNDASPTFPASLPLSNVISVAATDRNDNLAGFSNYGSKSVDLAAPGVDILSTTLGGGYGYNSGTSMATPHVAGAAALLWVANPTWSYQTVISRILGSVDKVPSLTGKTSTGGRLNLGKALGAPVVTVVQPTITSATWSGSAANNVNKVRVTFDKAIALSSFTPGDVKLTIPGNKLLAVTSVKVVSGSGDRSFDVNFATQTAGGDYRLQVGPEVTDVSGTKMKAWTGSYKLSAVVANVSPPVVVAASGTGTTANNLNKVRVTFDRTINVPTFTAADVRLTGPSGQTIVVSKVVVVAGTTNKVFDITFAVQSAAGSYSVTVGPEVMDTSGIKMKVWSSAFRVTAPVVTVAAPFISGVTASGTTANNLNKVRVTFDRTISVPTFTAADVKLTGPSGQTIPVSSVVVVAGTTNKTFDITFAVQSAAGSYSVTVGPEVMDTSGIKMKVWSGTFKVIAPVVSVTAPFISGATASGTTANNLNKVRVTFNRTINVPTFTAADVKLTGPSGQTIAVSKVVVVAGTTNKTFDITFATQTAVGNYTMTIGPEVMDPTWTKMKLWSGVFRVNAPSAAPTVATTYSSPTKLAVAPIGKAVSLLTIADDVKIADLNVRVTLKHPRMSDLYIHLQAPDGTNVVLTNRHGGTSANLSNTTFDDQASAAVGSAALVGTFRPASPLAAMNLKSLKGTWKLWIEDRAGVNRGTLEGWSMVVKKP